MYNLYMNNTSKRVKNNRFNAKILITKNISSDIVKQSKIMIDDLKKNLAQMNKEDR